TSVSALPMSGAATSIQLSSFTGSDGEAFLISGGRLVVIHAGNMQREEMPLPVHAVAFALGSFIYDRNCEIQIAVLDVDGTIHIVAHPEFDSHAYTNEELNARPKNVRRGFGSGTPPRSFFTTAQGWKIIESFPVVAPFSSGVPVLVGTRISDHHADDVM